MTASYILSLGILACAIPDHPLAKQWADYATNWEEAMLANEVGSNGEWMCEGSHYSYVSLAPLVVYPYAAQRAGFADYTNDPRLKKMILFFAKQQTIHDPRFKNNRVTPIYGRGTYSDSLGIFGVAARIYAKSDPEYSRNMQWMWIENGNPTNIGDGRLGDYDTVFMDRNLPSEAPKWTSDLSPGIGALLRADFNTPSETYLSILSNVQSERNLDIWTPGIGGINQWFGRGKPISASFSYGNGYNERHEMLRDGVRLARNWSGLTEKNVAPFGYYSETKFGAFAPLPQADYVRTRIVNTRVDDRAWMPPNVPTFPTVKPATEGKLDWTRQLMLLKDATPRWSGLCDPARHHQRWPANVRGSSGRSPRSSVRRSRPATSTRSWRTSRATPPSRRASCR